MKSLSYLFSKPGITLKESKLPTKVPLGSGIDGECHDKLKIYQQGLVMGLAGHAYRVLLFG
jgi:hypothetical protein